MESIAFQLSLIGVLGIGAQWVAWRTQIPAIVLLLFAGLVAGPMTGLLTPEPLFGDLLRPLIGLAVAVILFEGGLTLNFAELKGTSVAVRRLVFLGAPITWGVTYLAARHVAGLEIATAAVFSGILVVTGPTVIMPLLRQARLPARVSSLLRWEAILADPLGALFAVIAYEATLIFYGHHASPVEMALQVLLAVVLAFAIGIGLGRALIVLFMKGWVPEFLKAAVLLISVLTAFEISNAVLEESGLLTVTILGVVIANSNIASFNEIRRFKETMTVLLVSGVFVLLTSTIKIEDLMSIGLRDILFVAVLMFFIRPVVAMLLTMKTPMTMGERLLCAWIAPRGVVAVAVSGLFGASLVDLGIGDGSKMVPLAFLVVVATVILHGFTLRPLARYLKLTKTEPDGVLIVGSSPWTIALAQRLREEDIPVLIADRNWNELRAARSSGCNTYFGEILSEAAEHNVDLGRYPYLIAATNNPSYNSLVCTDFGPEIGRSNVFQIGRDETGAGEKNALPSTIGGRPLTTGDHQLSDLLDLLNQGWSIRKTKISDEYRLEDFRDSLPEEAFVILKKRASGRLTFKSSSEKLTAEPNDVLFSFMPATASGDAAKTS